MSISPHATPQLPVIDFETETLDPPDPERQKCLSPDAKEVVNTMSTTSSSATKVNSGVPKGSRLPRWAQPRPISGLLALLLVLGCVFFTLAILIASDKRPIDSWSVQPTVYPAIAAAVANSAISYAFAQATVIAWFYRASKGSTIRTLERQWEASDSLMHALLQGRNMNIVAVAAILVALMIVDGPLIQRASTVVVATQSNMVTLNFTLAPEVPRGLSGNWQYDNLVQSNAAIEVAQDWTAKSLIPFTVDPPCAGSCAGKLIGPGVVKTDCSTHSWPISKTMYYSPNVTWGSQGADGEDFYYVGYGREGINPLFYVGADYHVSGLDTSEAYQCEAIWLNVGIMDLRDFSGTYTETTCWLFAAVLECDVLFDQAGHVKVLTDAKSTSRLVALANNTMAVDESPQHINQSQPSTMDFFTMYLGIFDNAFVKSGQVVDGTGFVIDFTTMNAQSAKYTNWLNNTNPLDIAFYDPTTDIVNDMNEMLFRAAVLASSWANLTDLIDPGLSPQQSVTANQTVTRNVYHADFRWYAAATALEMLVALAVLPLFWGWWTLDRHVSFSPVTLGLAFNAPLLGGIDPAEGAKGAVKQFGSTHVRYGVVTSEDPGSGLRSGSHVKEFGNVSRIGIAESRYVVAK
ncbi:hypothetical protein LTR27_004703 [Elasticomyces elasticus]|nr:hypothetical protein LTR27_004703 [Elasticomyces elasticus]